MGGRKGRGGGREEEQVGGRMGGMEKGKGSGKEWKASGTKRNG